MSGLFRDLIALFVLPAVCLAGADRLKPLLDTHCSRCHGAQLQAGGINFASLLSADSPVRHGRIWMRAMELVRGREMPPAQPQPSEEEREKIVSEIDSMLRQVDWSKIRNPGSVIAPRLNRTEYNNSIRDLTGLDLRPADAFPVDPPGESGFDNDREGLFVPPLLLEKYLAAANLVVDEVILATQTKDRVARLLEIERMRNTETQGRVLPYGYDLQAVQNTVYEYVRFPRSGTYTFRVRAWGTNDSRGRIPGLALKIDDAPRGQHVVTSTAKQPGDYVFQTFIRSGSRRVSVHFFPYLTTAPEFTRNSKGAAAADGRAVLSLDHIEISEPEDSRQRESGATVFIASPGAGVSPKQAARAVIERFAQRAWRRPVSKQEMDRLLALYDRAQGGGQQFAEAAGTALKSILISPNFLFRLEGSPKPGVEYRLSDYELASRLSYFLWLSTPDAVLLDLAARGKLRDPKALDEQVRGMVADPKFESFVSAFFPQWLGFAELGRSAAPDRTAFPVWSDALGDAMIDEARLFFGEMMRQDRSLLEILDAKHTWVNEELAAIYGVPGIVGRQMRRVELTDRNRGGVLGMGAVLAATSLPVRTSPVVRGKWLLETMLGENLPPPPANAGDLPEAKGELAKMTLRQRFELHRQAPQCASCHNRIDPLGYGLENFDAVGRWRDQDNGQPVDSEGVLKTGERFRGPAELKSILLARKEQFARSAASRMLEFALGRHLRYYDEPVVDQIARSVVVSGFKPSVLLSEVVRSYPFRFKKVDQQEGKSE